MALLLGMANPLRYAGGGRCLGHWHFATECNAVTECNEVITVA